MASFKKWYIPFKFLKDKFLYFDPSNPLEDENTTRNSIQGNNLDLVQYIQDAITNGLITLSDSGQGNTSLSYYHGGEGFWIFGDLGVTVEKTNVGEYTINIPEDVVIISSHKFFTDAETETTSSGSVIITVDYNTSKFHTSLVDAKYATAQFIWDNGEQYNPSATGSSSVIGITAMQSNPFEGSNQLTLTNVSGAIDSLNLSLKLTF